ncbi:MAG TPA: hypothetical protein VFD58_19420 [Blastocatellia bacterium]|nr:hypothetical protein [Blastocatellia bacterium]
MISEPTHRHAFTLNYARPWLRCALITVAVSVGASLQCLAQSATPPPASQQSEVEQLRGEVRQLRAEMERLRALVEKNNQAASLTPAAPQTGTGAETKPLKEARVSGVPQASSEVVDNPKVAMATKAQGGDLSGNGTLLRTDRITIGGYGDFQFRQAAINERADGGGVNTFQNTRFVLGVAAVLSEKQNIVFNSEIEYEFGSKEIDVEQAFVEWKMKPEIAVRGGIFAAPLGRFNVYHDSNLNLTTIRPLINQFIVPSAYRDAGVGIRGRFKLPHKMKLNYEADVVNGMRGVNADGDKTPFSRLLGQSSAAEPGLIAFQAVNKRKAVVGRIGFSPVPGFEFGVSGYNGHFNEPGDAPQSANIFFFDASWQRGNLAINGEYGRSNIVGGVLRQSPTPPKFIENDPDSLARLSEFVAETSPGQDGFYVEGTYRFRPHFMDKRFDDGGYLAPVVRYEAVRLDRTLKDFYLNRSRTTIGLNFAPSSTVIFKFSYLFNHPFGKVPNAPAGIGGAEFGESPLPHLRYGRNGFTGSVAYVF